MATIETGVGTLPVPTGLAGQMAMLAHNAEVRNGRKATGDGGVRLVQLAARGASQAERGPKGGLPVVRSVDRPRDSVPSGRLNVKFYEQWERQLMWATMRALLDHDIVPRPQAIGMARRMASRVMAEYAPKIVEFSSLKREKRARCPETSSPDT